MTIKFTDLGLSPEALEAIAKKGFEEPTEIQAKAIPLLLAKDAGDIIAQAQTGTGKTATFGLVFADRLIPRKFKTPQAIVLAPTRELAVQVSEELNSLKGSKNFSIVPIYGGQSWGMQTKHLRSGVDVVVGTPGRIMEHLQKGTLKLDTIEYFVLDEADEMLNMGFVEDIEKILSYAPAKKKVLLFSATMPSRIANLAKKYMTNPEIIKTEKDRITNNSVDQIYFEVGFRDKFEALCRIVDMEEEFYGIIFTRTKISADEISSKLNGRGYKAEAFHGDISQDRREKILREFKKKSTEILVATDVAARGIDVSDLTHVINYALPQNSESYVHRIGRTGRAGKSGKAITLITPNESRKLRDFEYRAKAKIGKQELPTAKEMVELAKAKISRNLAPILDSADLTKYRKLAAEIFPEHDDMTIVAALLKYAFSENLDERSYQIIRKTNSRENSARQSGRDRSRGRDRDCGAHQVNQFGEARLFLTTGKQDGATVPKILQMVENEFGVAGSTIGKIDIMDSFTFISAPLEQAEQILDAFHRAKRAGGRPSVRVEKASNPKSRGAGGGRGQRRKLGGKRRSNSDSRKPRGRKR
jgi:ATP-dependent RNA helicase DeaD